MAKFEYVEWLFWWLLETVFFEFEWDAGNGTKSLLKHGVSQEEVEQVFTADYRLPLGQQYQPEADEDRYGIIGATESGKVLMVAFTLRVGRVRPISARPANLKERSIYEKVR